MDPERKRIADAVTVRRDAMVACMNKVAKIAWEYGIAAEQLAVAQGLHEAAVREDERWELMARSEASPT
jgi:hypothetical protein